MPSSTKVLISPYCQLEGIGLWETLVKELSSGEWESFHAAVAFGKASGNIKDLVDALVNFAKRGGIASLTFGADDFGHESKSSDYQAIEDLLALTEPTGRVKLFLYREPGRTFHPKVYLFENVTRGKALLIVGSSNWSAGGLVNNVEANVLLWLAYADRDDYKILVQIKNLFADYWTEQ